MDEENKKPFEWFDGKIEYSRIPKPEQSINPETEQELQKRFAGLINQSLEAALLPQGVFGEPEPLTKSAVESMYQRLESTLPKRPLTIDEAIAVTRSLEKPFMLCGQSTVLRLSRILRKKGFALRRIRSGYWEAEDDKTLIALGVSPFATKGEMYVMEAALPRLNPTNFFERNIGTRPLLWGISRYGF